MESMKPQEAINILEEATGRLLLNRADHLLVARALETLREETKETK